MRTADDIADHATLPPAEKLALLDRLEAGLLGGNADDAVAVRLRAALAERDLSPKHAQDLIAAFKLDVTKLRYRDWDDLMSYCSLSAMPVGRFVCDVHGESRARLAGQRRVVRRVADHQPFAGLQGATIAISTGSIFRRTRSPRAAPASRRSARERATPQLLDCLHKLAARTERLLGESDDFAASIADRRLGLEVCGHQHAGASADAHLAGARSAERARASVAGPPSPD